MDAFMAVFAGIFTAELGDKTQVATLLFAAEGALSRREVFIAAGSALLLSAALGALCGSLLGRLIPTAPLETGAGLLFIVMGLKFLREGLALRRGEPPCAS